MIEEYSKETQEWSKLWNGKPSKAPVLNLDERLRRIERKLLILGPPELYLSKYPALAQAYAEYKTIEKLTVGDIDET